MEVIDEGNEFDQVGSGFVAVVDVTSAQIFLLLRLFPFYLGDLDAAAAIRSVGGP